MSYFIPQQLRCCRRWAWDNVSKRMTWFAFEIDFAYLHLSGFFSHWFFSLKQHIRRNIKIFSVEYRLAEKYPFPTGLFDTISAYAFLVEKAGYDPKQIIIEGDSAGGKLFGLFFSMLSKCRLPLMGFWWDFSLCKPFLWLVTFSLFSAMPFLLGSNR